MLRQRSDSSDSSEPPRSRIIPSPPAGSIRAVDVPNSATAVAVSVGIDGGPTVSAPGGAGGSSRSTYRGRPSGSEGSPWQSSSATAGLDYTHM